MRQLSPSDLAALAPASVRVAGRVTRADGDVEIADAFASVRVEIAAHDLAFGDLVVVEGAWSGERVTAGRVVEATRPRAPSTGGEFARGARLGAFWRTRARVLAGVRAHFVGAGFLEVETPCAVPSPGLDLHLDAYDVPGLGYLGTSPEYQMKRLLAGGVPRCFQITKCFRRGEIGARHNPEFTMLEWYRAFEGVEAMLRDTEELVRAVMGRDHVVVEGTRVDMTAPFARVTVAEAFERHAGVRGDDAITLASTDEDAFFRLLVERVEPGLAKMSAPVFLTEYPAPQASLARKKPSDPRVAERFELYVGGLELCNGFGELTDPVEQRARLAADQAARAAAGLPVYPIDERFLAALEEGMPPAAGNALGLDRLVALAAGASRIGDAMTFPADVL